MKLQHPLLWRIGLPLLPLALLLSGLLLARPLQATGRPQATAVPTPGVDSHPDACEPNDAPERACVLTQDSVSSTLTFLPDGDVDYYSVNLGEERVGATTITVRGSNGLDLLTTISRAGETAPLTTISNPAISTTLAAELVGWIVLRSDCYL